MAASDSIEVEKRELLRAVSQMISFEQGTSTEALDEEPGG